MSNSKIVITDNAPKSKYPHDQAIVVDRTAYVSGCVGIDKDNSKIVEGGVVAETIQVSKNFVSVLEAAGSRPENVLKVIIFVEDMGDFAAVNEEHKKVVSKDFPARACVQAAQLPVDAKVEIEAVALIGEVETVFG